MVIRFAADNDFGVLDHVVTTSAGAQVHVPMRVVPNGSGSVVLFTLFQLPGMSPAQFAEDQALVQADLQRLRAAVERDTSRG
jgi:hypothetical protein